MNLNDYCIVYKGLPYQQPFQWLIHEMVLSIEEASNICWANNALKDGYFYFYRKYKCK